MSSYLRMVFVNECVYLLNCVRESDLRGRKGAPSPVPFYNYSVLASQNVMDDFRTWTLTLTGRHVPCQKYLKGFPLSFNLKDSWNYL